MILTQSIYDALKKKAKVIELEDKKFREANVQILKDELENSNWTLCHEALYMHKVTWRTMKDLPISDVIKKKDMTVKEKSVLGIPATTTIKEFIPQSELFIISDKLSKEDIYEAKTEAEAIEAINNAPVDCIVVAEFENSFI
jgi:hypothetical protein